MRYSNAQERGKHARFREREREREKGQDHFTHLHLLRLLARDARRRVLRLRGLELEQRARVVQPLQQRERGRVRGVLTLRVRVRRVVRGGAQRGDEVLRVGDRGQRALDIGEQRLGGREEGKKEGIVQKSRGGIVSRMKGKR